MSRILARTSMISDEAMLNAATSVDQAQHDEHRHALDLERLEQSRIHLPPVDDHRRGPESAAGSAR